MTVSYGLQNSCAPLEIHVHLNFKLAPASFYELERWFLDFYVGQLEASAEFEANFFDNIFYLEIPVRLVILQLKKGSPLVLIFNPTVIYARIFHFLVPVAINTSQFQLIFQQLTCSM